MKRCTKCGMTNEPGEVYCSNCGNGIQQNRTIWKFSTLILGLLVVLAGIGIHFYIKEETSATVIAQPVYNAIINKDSNALYKQIGKPIDFEGTNEELIDYLNTQDMVAFKDRLIASVRKVKNEGKAKPILHEDGTPLFVINPQKRFALYPAAKFEWGNKLTYPLLVSNNVNSKGKESVEIEQLKKEAIFSAKMKNDASEATLFVISVDKTMKQLDENSALGEQGDMQYSGELAFYLAEVDGKVGYLQDQLMIPELIINLDRFPFGEYMFKEQSLITIRQIEASNLSTAYMWTYAQGEMKEVLFDDSASISISGDRVKFLKEQYMQSYIYNNGEGEWIYNTWKWDEEKTSFIGLSEKIYKSNVQFGVETGKRLEQAWKSKENYYVSYPEFTFNEKSLEHFEKGILLADGISIGTTIDELLTKLSTPSDEGYFEGAHYYSFSGGATYFYDDAERQVTSIAINSDSITNDLAALEMILGEPVSSDYDEETKSTMNLYQFGEYRLMIDIDTTDQSFIMDLKKNK